MKLSTPPVIETKRLLLRLARRSDLPALFAVNGDDEVVRYTPHASWKTPADGEAWFSRVTANHDSGAALEFVVVLRDGGRPIGTMSLFHFNKATASGEVGYSLAREHWGKGLTKEALIAFVQFSFETLGLKRLEANVDPRNAASATVLVRAGFTHEGHQRRNYFAKDEISDTGLYGMLSDDPRPGVI